MLVGGLTYLGLGDEMGDVTLGVIPSTGVWGTTATADPTYDATTHGQDSPPYVTPQPGAIDDNGPWKPTGAIAETFSRKNCSLIETSTPSSGTLRVSGITLPAGRPVSSITFVTGNTAAGSPTHQFFALLDLSANVVAVTTDDLATAWAGNTAKTLFVARTVTDGAITSGSNRFASTAAAFTTADNSRQITVLGAGAAGAQMGTSAVPVYMKYVDASHVDLYSDAGLTSVLNASTTVASAGTAYIATPYTPTSTAGFYVGELVVASPMPTNIGVFDAFAQVEGIAPIPAGNSTASLTTPASLTSPATAVSAAKSKPYAYVS